MHFRDNCKIKLLELKISSVAQIMISQDILGSFLEGKHVLVGTLSAKDIKMNFFKLKTKWKNLASGFFD